MWTATLMAQEQANRSAVNTNHKSIAHNQENRSVLDTTSESLQAKQCCLKHIPLHSRRVHLRINGKFDEFERSIAEVKRLDEIFKRK